jgi:hypothetical protein
VELGQQAAKANLERRDGDGIPIGPWPPTEGQITRPVYQPTGLPGNYAFTPPFDAPPLGPIALFPGGGAHAVHAAARPASGAGAPARAPAMRPTSIRSRIGGFTSAIRTEGQTGSPGSGSVRGTRRSTRCAGIGRSWRAARSARSTSPWRPGIACFKAKYRFATARSCLRRGHRDNNRHRADSG